ncbi:helix-turn-helix transcriptional regulator [Mycolicibacterium sp.]|uniref:helix-turn-helix domain-containing protein n=1 Tax=Mycolicibacterium sp. TaxID=2320850 RepID=UPI0028AB1E89|nr:helix-turn-helix transcriptional regulator [Mycolicibacterium sp.]
MTTAFDQGQIPSFEMRHRLQLAREYAGLSRSQLANRMEISRNSVLNGETGRTVPRKIVLNAWAMACGVPVSWLLTGEPPADHPGPPSGLGIISLKRVRHDQAS